MILRTFSIFDIKSETFSPPFFMSTAGEAIRAFKDLVNDSSTSIGRHPEDYRLMCLGTFDNHKGLLDSESQDSFGFGSDYKDIGPSQIPLGLVKP
ncbi:nonstructural protein [Chifec microvirus UA13_19]|nr:nonstructural protein [Chifec microvirus UA13_19]